MRLLCYFLSWSVCCSIECKRLVTGGSTAFEVQILDLVSFYLSIILDCVQFQNRTDKILELIKFKGVKANILD